MKNTEILTPAKYGKQTVVQATTESGKLLGLYFDADNRVIPNSGEWTIVKATKKSNAIISDIISSLEGHGLAADFDGTKLTVNI